MVVDAGGVGYQVLVPISSFDHLNPRVGAEITLLTHLHIRENAHTLYGFATAEERDIFLLLVDRVSGIGPATAMAVLSGMPVERFKQSVVESDVKAISTIKGLGKKTAERIVLELKDKVGVNIQILTQDQQIITIHMIQEVEKNMVVLLEKPKAEEWVMQMD